MWLFNLMILSESRFTITIVTVTGEESEDGNYRYCGESVIGVFSVFF